MAMKPKQFTIILSSVGLSVLLVAVGLLVGMPAALAKGPGPREYGA